MSGSRLYVGTSGWSYRHWRGVFYPKGLKQGEWLGYFAQHFDTVEINMTFYRLPRRELLERWAGETPGGFEFAVKLWRMITHQKKLRDCKEPLERFTEAIGPLRDKMGPLLVQLPPSMNVDPERLAEFLELVDGMAAYKRVTVEFRDTSWLTDEVYSILDHHEVAPCLADMPKCPITRTSEAPFVYVRRHGPEGDYRGKYSPQQIGAQVRHTRKWLEQGRDVYVYFNNDIEGHAVNDALKLKEKTLAAA